MHICRKILNRLLITIKPTIMHTIKNQGNGTALNSKLRWVVLSIIGFVLILFWGNKVIGLFSRGDEKVANQASKELRSKFSYSMVLIPAGEFQMGTNYNAISPSRNPKGPNTGFYKVFRGGSWRDSPDLVRVNVRVSGTPRLRYNPIGFRLAKQKPYGIFAFCQAMWDKVCKNIPVEY